MTRTLHSTGRTVTAIGIIAILGCNAFAFAPRYVATVLEEPELNTVVPFDINNQGVVTGFAFHGFGGFTQQPFFWEDGELHQVPTTWDKTEGHCFDDEGNAYGIAYSNGAIIHITPNGITPVASAPVNSWTRITRVTSSGYVGGNIYDDGFLWHPSSGYQQFSALDSSDAATFADVNEAGLAVGTINEDSFTGSSAFYFQDGNLVEFTSILAGSTWAVSVDEQGRILVVHDFDGGTSLYHAELSADGIQLGAPLVTFTGEMHYPEARANEQGDMVMTWRYNDHVWLWMKAPGSDEFLEFEVPEEMIAVELFGLTESGVAWGRFLNEDYEGRGFMASVDDGLMLLHHRIVGQAPMPWGAVPRDLNDADQMIISYAYSNNYGIWAVLKPAADGDANGDGSIDVSDVLLVIDAWGPQSPDAICGPDLDMNGEVEVNDLLAVLAAYGG